MMKVAIISYYTCDIVFLPMHVSACISHITCVCQIIFVALQLSHSVVYHNVIFCLSEWVCHILSLKLYCFIAFVKLHFCNIVFATICSLHFLCQIKIVRLLLSESVIQIVFVWLRFLYCYCQILFVGESFLI